MIKIIYSFLFCAFTLVVSGQVVTTAPDFPTQFDDVTIYFDAKQGNAGLEGFDGDVYAHTGVITTESNSPVDWRHVQGEWGVAFPKTKMTPVGDDVYTISYNISEFYGLDNGEIVEALAFVFRNTDGSVTGRATDGSDIYTPVYLPDDGLLLSIQSPGEGGSIILDEDSLNVKVAVSQKALVTIADNDVEIFRDSAEMVDFYILNPEPGLHTLTFNVSIENDSIQLTREYIVLESDETQLAPPVEGPDGLFYYMDSSYLFKLHAPGKRHVFLLTPQNNFLPDITYRMRKSLDGETFWILVNKSDFPEGETVYQYLVDGEIRIADPYSTVVLDPYNDAFVPDETMDELPLYPEQTSGLVTAFDYEKLEFAWTDFIDYEMPDQHNIVIYEMLMRDFLGDHSYESLLDTLDYLERLGVTAIELMPVNEFEGNLSWGYNPSFHMALDKYYGSRRQFKMVVDAAHARGIAVILDVVYNHVFSQSPLAQMYWDAANFRPAPDNPWLNVIPKHPFNVGYDVNHESEATKRWVKQTLGYWMAEFHIDGFRFDLSKGFTQKNSGQNADLMAQYDSGRVAILKDYADFIWSINSDAYVILEHFAYNEEEIELANYGMMLWGNMNHEFSKATRAIASDLEWLDYTERGWNSPNVVGYMESHDEERLMVHLLNSSFGLERALERIETASSIFYMVPGPKMLWQFGELGFDYSINRCVNGTVNNDCRLAQKPTVWNYLENEERAELNEVVSNLLHLKANYPTFQSEDFVFNDGNLFLKTIHFNHEEMDAVVMANFRETSSDINPKFQSPGVWYEYFTGDSLIVENTEEKLTHVGGEYRIYTTKRITPPGGFTTSLQEEVYVNGSIFPNPIQAGGRLNIKVEGVVRSIEVFDQLGGRHMVTRGRNFLTLPATLPSGLYHLNVETDRGFLRKSFVVQN